MVEEKGLKEALRAPFPKEAQQTKTIEGKRGSWTQHGYKPGYVTERLNDVFGYEGWTVTLEKFAILKGTEVQEVNVLLSEKYATVYVKLEVNRGSKAIVRYQFGTSGIRQSIGDALKGALTDGLKKCAGYLDIGLDAYKGEVEAGYAGSERNSDFVSEPDESEKEGEKKFIDKEELFKKIDTIIKKLGISPEEVEKLAKECEAEDFISATTDQLTKMVGKLSDLWNKRQREKKGDGEK